MFLSADPVQGIVGGQSIRFNPYIYAGANPTNYVDPNGQCFFGLDTLVCIGAGALLFGANELRAQIYHNQMQGINDIGGIVGNLDFGSLAWETIKGGVAGGIISFNVWVSGFGTAASSPAWVSYAVGASSGASTNVLGGIITGRYDYDFSQSLGNNFEQIGKNLGVDAFVGGVGGALFTGAVNAPLNYVSSRHYLAHMPNRAISNITRNVIAGRAIGAGLSNAVQGVAAHALDYYVLGDETAGYADLGDFAEQFAADFGTGVGALLFFDVAIGLPQAQIGRLATVDRNTIRSMAKIPKNRFLGYGERLDAVIEQLRQLIALNHTFYGNQTRQSVTNIITTTNTIVPIIEGVAQWPEEIQANPGVFSNVFR